MKKENLTKKLIFILSLAILFAAGCKKEEMVLNQTKKDSASKTANLKGMIVPATVTWQNVTYHTVVIGTQVWMVENFRGTTRHNPGYPDINMHYATSKADWESHNSDYEYCYPNFQESNAGYGLIYNGRAAALTQGCDICPPGWHVPTQQDYAVLISFWGGESNAGKALKEAGLNHWKDPNTGTNSSRFTAFGAGHCLPSGTYQSFMADGDYWTKDIAQTGSPYFLWYVHMMNYSNWANLFEGTAGGDCRGGKSIRLIMN